MFKRSRFDFLARSVIALCGVLLIGAIAVFSQSSPEEQLPTGAAKEKAGSACLVCHEARIIVQQRLDKAAWTKEVDKMAKWGAGVDPKDRDALIDYLSTNFRTDQPAYEAPRTEVGSAEKSKNKH